MFISNSFAISLKISIFTPLEQGKFLTEKHRSYIGAKSSAFFGETL